MFSIIEFVILGERNKNINLFTNIIIYLHDTKISCKFAKQPPIAGGFSILNIKQI